MRAVRPALQRSEHAQHAQDQLLLQAQSSDSDDTAAAERHFGLKIAFWFGVVVLIPVVVSSLGRLGAALGQHTTSRANYAASSSAFRFCNVSQDDVDICQRRETTIIIIIIIIIVSATRAAVITHLNDATAVNTRHKRSRNAASRRQRSAPQERHLSVQPLPLPDRQEVGHESTLARPLATKAQSHGGLLVGALTRHATAAAAAALTCRSRCEW